MGQVLHGSATTTEAVRRAIQRSEESIRALARRHGISPTTVHKWRRRASVSDARMGPKAIHSTVLTIDEEAMVVAFRRHTLLPLACPGEGRRLPLHVATHHPAPVAFNPASLPPAPRHQPAARYDRRQGSPERSRRACQAEVQGLPDWLLPHRPQPALGQALPKSAPRKASCTSMSGSTAPPSSPSPSSTTRPIGQPRSRSWKR